MMNIYKNKKVIITGHTGFKGSWLTSWLIKLGADVTGISLNIPTRPSHFETLKIKRKIENYFFDINDFNKLKKVVFKSRPDYIFHLAAQALVKESYQNPLTTFKSNTVGTLNLLEILRTYKKKCTVVIITSDKVYKNLESKKGYKENSILGGIDPYSASKASAEIIINSYIKSYFLKKEKNKNISIAVARAGNVIGGGDWAKNRIIPDCMKAWSKNKKVILRNPNSTRPWQHVLEAVWGYLSLASKLRLGNKLHCQAFNFGPNPKNNYSVIKIIKIMSKNWKNIKWKFKKEKNQAYETNILKLDSSKSLKFLNWKCILTIKETMFLVSEWYMNFYTKNSHKQSFTLKQIDFYEKILKKRFKK